MQSMPYLVAQPAFWPPEQVYMPGLPEMILNQCNYYFSVENLVKDEFLRNHMDHEGWVPLQLLATFHRLRSLSSNQALIESVRA